MNGVFHFSKRLIVDCNSLWVLRVPYKHMSQASPVCSKDGPSSKPKLLVIAGTTSVGKTDLSLRLASLLNGEIISADSAQVYRKLDIGSAKVDREITSRVSHHLLDVADIDSEEKFSMADYCSQAEKAIKEIISRGHVPLIVGGTGLYIRTLLQGGVVGSPPSTNESQAMIERIIQEEDDGNWEKSFSRLKDLDPVYAASLSVNDWYRLRRALEICILSGSTVTSFEKKLDVKDCPYESKCLFLSMPRVELFQRIDARCEAIIEAGLIQEVISLVKKDGLKSDSQAGRSVGYRQVLEYLQSVWGFPSEEGESKGKPYSLQVPKEDLKKHFYEFLCHYKSKTRRLAQTQLTWFKKQPDFHWLNMSAGGGSRLSLDAVSEAVASWFKHEAPLPTEWNGKSLQTLTPTEVQILRGYSCTHCKPLIFADEDKVESLMMNTERCLQL